jgi:hypothetical protein
LPQPDALIGFAKALVVVEQTIGQITSAFKSAKIGGSLSKKA